MENFTFCSVLMKEFFFLQPENIVCTNKDSMDIKIIDFGYAKQLEHKKDIKITAGSPEFVGK